MTADKMKNILFIAQPKEWIGKFKNLPIDPNILIPIEVQNPQKFNIKNLKPEMITTALLKIMAYHPQHKHIDQYRELLSYINPKLEEELTQIAIIKTDQKDYVLACEIFEALAGFNPVNRMHKLNLSLVYENMYNHFQEIGKKNQALEYQEKAEASYTNLLKNNPPEEALYHGGSFFLRRGEISQAMVYLMDFVSNSKDEEKVSKAKSWIEEYQDIDEMESLFHKTLQDIKDGKTKEALNNSEKLILMNSKEWKHWHLKGLSLRLNQEFQKAAEAFGEALTLENKEPEIYNELAICLSAIKKTKESMEALKLGLQYDPINIKILSNLAILHLQEKDFSQAQELFEQILEIDPEDVLALEYLNKINNA